MPLKCSPHIAPSGVPCIRPPKPLGPDRPQLPVMSVNGKRPNAWGDVEVTIPEIVAPSAEGEGKAADAKAVYDAVNDKVNKESGKGLSTNDFTDAHKQKLRNISNTYGYISLGVNTSVTGDTGVVIGDNSQVENGVTIGRAALSTGKCVAIGYGAFSNDPSRPIVIAAGDTTLKVGADGTLWVNGNSVGGDGGGGGYKFEDAVPDKGGYININPNTIATFKTTNSNAGIYYYIDLNEVEGVPSDACFVVDCHNATEPPIICWGAGSCNFFPRTDAETDFACEAGKMNVYWITQIPKVLYSNSFVVAGYRVHGEGFWAP